MRYPAGRRPPRIDSTVLTGRPRFRAVEQLESEESLRTEAHENTMPIEYVVIHVVLGAASIEFLLATCFRVDPRTTAIVQRLGKNMREVGPGMHFKLPLVDRVVGRIDLRVQELNVRIDTQTRDSIGILVSVAVQYSVLPEKAYYAFCQLGGAQRQISSDVLNVVGALAPKFRLEEICEMKDEVSKEVEGDLKQVMVGFGYGVRGIRVTCIKSDPEGPGAVEASSGTQRGRVGFSQRLEAVRGLWGHGATGEDDREPSQVGRITVPWLAAGAGRQDLMEGGRPSFSVTETSGVMAISGMTPCLELLMGLHAASRESPTPIRDSPRPHTTSTAWSCNRMI